MNSHINKDFLISAKTIIYIVKNHYKEFLSEIEQFQNIDFILKIVISKAQK